ncbi:hypothetical protein BKA70DRAFT_1281977 [Coprinopsis sp. MPI-PUGE-AT-0042]|nr:hypothetical protein BKA70DRAFT_1281977 [Coprinopsis sp. MPI-PUGE-AT-0042]
MISVPRDQKFHEHVRERGRQRQSQHTSGRLYEADEVKERTNCTHLVRRAGLWRDIAWWMAVGRCNSFVVFNLPIVHSQAYFPAHLQASTRQHKRIRRSFHPSEEGDLSLGVALWLSKGNTADGRPGVAIAVEVQGWWIRRLSSDYLMRRGGMYVETALDFHLP